MFRYTSWALDKSPFVFWAWLLQWLLDGGSDADKASQLQVDYDNTYNFGKNRQQLDSDLVSAMDFEL